MRIIDVKTEEEVCVADTLTMSRFESLSATDYHLDVLPAIRVANRPGTTRGTLEAIGGGIWDASIYTWDATIYAPKAIGEAYGMRQCRLLDYSGQALASRALRDKASKALVPPREVME